MRTFLAVLVLAVSGAAAATGQKLEPCDGNTASIYGTAGGSGVTGGTIDLEWTALEDSTIHSYELWRIPAECRKGNCGEPIVGVELDADAKTETGKERAYRFRDSVEHGDWIYRLVIEPAEGDPCFVEADPVYLDEPPPCGIPRVCDEVKESFVAEVESAESPEVTLRWETTAEDGSIRAYRLKRIAHDCRNAGCIARVARVSANGECGLPQRRQLVVTPPAGAWAWRLEVVDRHGDVACYVDVVP